MEGKKNLFCFLVEMDRNDVQTSFGCILATFSLFFSNRNLPLSYHSTIQKVRHSEGHSEVPLPFWGVGGDGGQLLFYFFG